MGPFPTSRCPARVQDAAMANWKRLEKLNGGEPIEPRTPRLDTQDEVWFYWPVMVSHVERREPSTRCPRM